jgi:CHAT domain-containing protein/Tfp pilus assembly protein PilF
MMVGFILLYQPAWGQPTPQKEWEARNARVVQLYQEGKYSDAVNLAQAALKEGEQLFGPDSPKVATPLSNLAALYDAERQYAKAEPLYRRALQIDETALGPMHPKVGTDLNNLALLYVAQGHYAEAEPLARRAFQIDETALGPTHPDVGRDLNTLALLYKTQGQYAEAEPFARRALKITEAAVGPTHPAVGPPLNTLAGLYKTQGKYAEAEPLYRRTLAIAEADLGPTHPHVGTALNNLAALYDAQGQYAKAEPLYRRALQIDETALGPTNPKVGTDLNNLAGLYVAQGHYAKAEPLYRRALQIDETALGPTHPDVGRDLYNLAGLYMRQEQYAEAEPLARRGLQIDEAMLGPTHPDVGRDLNNLAGLYGSQGQYAKALPLFQRGLTIETRFLQDVFSRSGEAHQFQFLRNNQGLYYDSLSLITHSLRHELQALTIGTDLVLSRKSLILDSQARTHDALLHALPPELRPTYQQWQEARTARGKLLLHRPPTYSAAAYRERLATLDDEIGRLEATLVTENSVVANTVKSQRATLAEVRQHLLPEEVLVEFVKFDDWADWGASRYVAFVVPPTQDIQLVDVGDAESLDRLVKETLAYLRQGAWQETLKAQQQTTRDLYDRLWQPLTAAIGDATTVVVSPDGLLNLVPFAALQTPEGKFLIEDYVLMTVTSGRDLVKEIGVLLPQSDLFLAADPAFEWMPPSLQPSRSKGVARHPEADAQPRTFPRLAGTAEALTLIPPLLPGARKVTLAREAATEAAVVEAKRPRVMHLATHGFFLEDQPELRPMGSTLALDDKRPLPPGYENPLVRSGLAFAGADHAARVADSEDGLLTAWEVSAMDLYGTDLVVLSACDTGAGEVRTGEGVYGLRRAFALVGVRNLVMSLWPVWDKQAAKQMKTFYTYYGQGMSPALALRKAQLERIAWMRTYLAAAPPSLWAPFMVQVSGSLQTLSQP